MAWVVGRGCGLGHREGITAPSQVSFAAGVIEHSHNFVEGEQGQIDWVRSLS